MAARYFLASRENVLLHMLYPIKKFPLVLLTIGIQDHLSGSSTSLSNGLMVGSLMSDRSCANG